MAYIVAVNPSILSAPGTGMRLSVVLTATLLLSFVLAMLPSLDTAISVWLMTRKSAFAFLAGIVSATLLGWAFGLVKPPDHVFSAPDFKTVFLKLDILGALKLSLVPAIIGIMFTDL